MADNSSSAAPAKKAMSQRKRVLVFVLCSLSALALCMAVVLGVATSIIRQEAAAESWTQQAAPEVSAPTDKLEIVGLISEYAANACSDKSVLVDISTWLDVPGDSITTDGTDSELGALKYMKNSLLGAVDGIYPEDFHGEFGNGYTAFPRITIAAEECSAAVCEQGRLNDDGELVDDDCYFFDITVDGGAYPGRDGSALSETFMLSDSGSIAAAVEKELSSTVKVDKADIVPGDFKIEAKAVRSSGQLEYILFSRSYKITLTVSFRGDLESLGTKTVGFDYTVYEQYNYKWAGVSFAENKLTVKKGESIPLGLSSVMNEDAEYEISFESSDESVAVVDEEIGYVVGVECSPEPVTITVRLRYLGVEYTDTCEVSVLVSVQEVRLSDSKLKLSVGETAEISASVKPDNATIKDIEWISNDESVAVVEGTDSSGNAIITAVGAGETTVIAVSTEGGYRAACALTVSD